MADEKRLVDSDALMNAMKERDDDNGGEPLNAIDKGYHLAVMHMGLEIEKLLGNTSVSFWEDYCNTGVYRCTSCGRVNDSKLFKCPNCDCKMINGVE